VKELSIEWSSIFISPLDLASFMVAMLKNELLPAPLGPNSPKISPGLIERLILDRAVNLSPKAVLYVLFNPVTKILLLARFDSYVSSIFSS